jgi:xylulokinase
MSYLLGVDIGTSGTKTVIFNEKGATVASSVKEYPLHQPKPGWAEQDPDDWWHATAESVKEVISKSGINPADIKGVGLSGQMHGLVLLDKENRVLRKSIIWCDQRTAAECDEITTRVGEKRLIEITANPALTGFTASKLLWVRNNEPAIYEKAAHVLLPKDYIRFKLTGEFATEVSDASGMQFIDIAKRDWSGEVLEKLAIDRALLPSVHESYLVTGKVHSAAAKLTSLAEGTPVVGGGGDQAAGAVGNGIVREGVVSSTIGTSGVVFAHTDRVTIDPDGRVHTFCHAVPGAWHVMGVTQGAGLSLQWFRNQFCKSEIDEAERKKVDSYKLMDDIATSRDIGCDGLLYLPYLMGERTPHLDPDARGVFFGLNARHTRGDMLRAVMEGVSHSLLDCMDIIRDMGIPVKEVRASGGGGRSKLWRQMQADMFGSSVTTTNSSEGPALGVALLAGVGTGVYKSVPEACDAAIKVVEKTDADQKASKTYGAYHGIYRSVYTALKSTFRESADIVRSFGN